MFAEGLRFASSLALLTAEAVADSARILGGESLVDLPPSQIRSLLLTFEKSIQGQIPDILGRDHDERVDTAVRLLRGSDEEDLNELIGILQDALAQLHDEQAHQSRSRRPRRQRP